MKSLALVPFLIPGIALAATVTGNVTDRENSAPLVGANVVVVGTKLGAATDVSGR